MQIEGNRIVVLVAENGKAISHLIAQFQRLETVFKFKNNINETKIELSFTSIITLLITSDI